MKTKKALIICLLTAGITLWGCKEDPYINAPGDNGQNLGDREMVDITDDASGLNVPANAITVKEALDICRTLGSGKTSAETYYIKGVVCRIQTLPGTTCECYIGDNIFAPIPDQLYCYRIKGLGNKDFESSDQIKVGNVVVVCAKLTVYNGTSETAYNTGYLYSTTWKEPVIETIGQGTFESPYTIGDLIKLGTRKEQSAYVQGYIIGANETQDSLTVTSLKTSAPFKANNIVLADKPGETDIAQMAPIQFPVGKVRNGVNLKDHPEHLGQLVLLYGKRTEYMGITGIKDVSYVKIGDEEFGTRP